MTNFEKWQFYTSNFTSPQSWLTFGYYYIIGAALQRRVWFYDDDGLPLFPNQYLIFVGPPGAGKGLVLGEISRFLKYHRMERGQYIKTNIGDEQPLLFPMGADSITFEELVADMASSMRRHPKPDKTVYYHTSYAFVLEELASLFKRKTEDVVKFLLNAYDCKNYDYKTKHQGKDLLRNLCLSFAAGTQADFLKQASSIGIFGQGFASRSLFLFEEDERFSKFHISDFTEDQKRAREDLLGWIKRLSTIYGQIYYDQETYGFLESWYREVFLPQKLKAPHKLKDYYSRKKVIMMKLATAIHYSENLNSIIGREAFMKAIDMLDLIEGQMAQGLNAGGRNELHSFSNKILAFVKSNSFENRTIPKRTIVSEFIADVSIEEIEKCLQELEVSGLKYKVEKGLKCYYYERA